MVEDLLVSLRIDLSLGHIVLDGNPAIPPAKGAQQPAPLFSAYVYCGHGRPSQLLLSSCYFQAFSCCTNLH